ncbi:MAG TPA: hypothetical protein VHL53_10110 [Acidimicrobiia bacterium]|nr:hypothetical protein [Acidimicrobiia bacterium]
MFGRLKAAMARRDTPDPLVGCPACGAAVPRRHIVALGARHGLLCPRCGELSFPRAAARREGRR